MLLLQLILHGNVLRHLLLHVLPAFVCVDALHLRRIVALGFSGREDGPGGDASIVPQLVILISMIRHRIQIFILYVDIRY